VKDRQKDFVTTSTMVHINGVEGISFDVDRNQQGNIVLSAKRRGLAVVTFFMDVEQIEELHGGVTDFLYRKEVEDA